ncbi:MAG: hypothetical protein J0M12_13475 [Deltaproteobacteria bacterium]|nr:hypothetical protein [Deltaproteobacteria bacterium]
MHEKALKHLSKADFLAWGTALVFLFWHLSPVLAGKPLAGWDLTSHYYLVTKMADFLTQGHTSGYDLNWFGGYSAFTLYPPLFYIFACIPHLVSFGLIPLQLSFNLLLFCIPLALLAALYFSSRQIFGSRYGAPALYLGILFLALPKDLAHWSVGLLGLFAVGLCPAFFAMALATFLIGTLEALATREKKTAPLVLISVLVAAIVLSHIIFAMFSGLIALVYLLFRSGIPRLRLAIAGATGLLLASWWWIPFILALPYSNSVTLGLPGDLPDPLFVLFPHLFTSQVFDFLTWETRAFLFPFSQNSLLRVPLFLLEVPVLGALFLGATLAGITTLCKARRFFLPALYVALLLLLPRNLLTQLAPDGLHTYRFLQPLYILQILIASAGLITLWDWVRHASHRRIAVSSQFLAIGLCAVYCFFSFSMHPTGGRPKKNSDDYVQPDLIYSLNLDAYPSKPEADEVLAFLKTLKPRGRIAADTAESIFRSLGSPHFFTSQIPLITGLPVLSGLLAESALSSGFIQPTMHGLTPDPRLQGHLLWGRTYLASLESFRAQKADTMIDRLGFYGVQYFVSAIYESREVLEESNKVTLVKKFPSFSIYELKSFSPLIQETNYRPFLFLDHGGMSFRVFTEQWFCHTSLLNRPVIYSPKAYESLSQDDREALGGFIVSWNSQKPFLQADYDKIVALGKPALILNAAPYDIETTSRDIVFVPDYTPWSGQKRFVELFSNLATPAEFNEVAPQELAPSTLSFKSKKGALVNFTFTPFSISENRHQELYWASSSMIWVFGAGENRIRFK